MTRCLYRPRPTKVRTGDDGVPIAVGKSQVESVREQWLVEDRWWAVRPVRRRYFELNTADGRDLVVFLDLESQGWHTQPGA
jgi:hypothetical protein